MNTNRRFHILLGLIILLLLVVADWWIFSSWFDMKYFDWYLQNGALIGIVTTAVSMVWGDMRQHTGLISAHPWNYIGSYLQLVGLPIFVFGTLLKRSKQQAEKDSTIDLVLTILFFIVLCALLICWLVVVVPLQYFIYLFCGAPGRLISNSERKAIARLGGKRLDVQEIGRHEKVPDGWWRAGIADKPVAITSLFSSLLFLVGKPLLAAL